MLKFFIVLPIRLKICRSTVFLLFVCFFTRQSTDKGKCDECIGKENFQIVRNKPTSHPFSRWAHLFQKRADQWVPVVYFQYFVRYLRYFYKTNFQYFVAISYQSFSAVSKTGMARKATYQWCLSFRDVPLIKTKKQAHC